MTHTQRETEHIWGLVFGNSFTGWLTGTYVKLISLFKTKLTIQSWLSNNIILREKSLNKRQGQVLYLLPEKIRKAPTG